MLRIFVCRSSLKSSQISLGMKKGTFSCRNLLLFVDFWQEIPSASLDGTRSSYLVDANVERFRVCFCCEQKLTGYAWRLLNWVDGVVGLVKRGWWSTRVPPRSWTGFRSIIGSLWKTSRSEQCEQDKNWRWTEGTICWGVILIFILWTLWNMCIG